MHPAFFVYHLAVVLVCVARRNHSFGGWLLFYLLELLLFGFVRLVTGAMSMHGDVVGFAPGFWPHPGEWIGFLLVNLPLPALAVAQLGLALGSAVRPAWRTPETLRRLRWVLGAELVAAAGVILIDAMLWPRNVMGDLNLVFWPLLWGGYFLGSKRVRRVFGVQERCAGFTPEAGP